MPAEPKVKRAVSFIDGQNLYRHAKDAFGHHHPNYDPRKLADAVCADRGWASCGVRFYTGVPSADRSPTWHGYWTRRLTAMRRAGIVVNSRSLRYRVEKIRLPDGSTLELPVEREKGIDLRLGLNVVRMARHAELDVAIIFSQDQDLGEVAREVRDISRSAGRWLKVVSAFPVGPSATVRRGSTEPTGFGWTETSTMPVSIPGTIDRIGGGGSGYASLGCRPTAENPDARRRSVDWPRRCANAAVRLTSRGARRECVRRTAREA